MDCQIGSFRGRAANLVFRPALVEVLVAPPHVDDRQSRHCAVIHRPRRRAADVEPAAACDDLCGALQPPHHWQRLALQVTLERHVLAFDPGRVGRRDQDLCGNFGDTKYILVLSDHKSALALLTAQLLQLRLLTITLLLARLQPRLAQNKATKANPKH